MRFNIFVVSDGTGRTAQQAVNAALYQFPDVQIDFIRRPGIRSPVQIKSVVREAAEMNATIIHTLVQDDIRHLIIRECRKQNIETIDLMGPLLSRLSHQFTNYLQENQDCSSY